MALKLAVLVAFLVGVFAITDVHFSLRYRGTCNAPIHKGGNCTGKGSSQTQQTLISSTDAVKFSVQEIVGAFSTLNILTNVLPNETVLEYGSLFFGIHLSQNHSINYDCISTFAWPLADGIVYTNVNGNLTGGTGQFEGIQGSLAYTARAVFNETTGLGVFEALLSVFGYTSLDKDVRLESPDLQ